MPPLDAQAELAVSDIVQPAKGLEPMLEKPARLTMDGRYEPAAKHAIVRQLRLDAGPMQVAGNADCPARREAERNSGAAYGRVRCGRVELLGRHLPFRRRGSTPTLTHKSGALRAQISAGIDRFASAMPELATLVGPNPTLNATISRSHFRHRPRRHRQDSAVHSERQRAGCRRTCRWSKAPRSVSTQRTSEGCSRSSARPSAAPSA